MLSVKGLPSRGVVDEGCACRQHGSPASKEPRQNLNPPGLGGPRAGKGTMQTHGVWHLLQGLGLAPFTGHEDSSGAVRGVGSPFNLPSTASVKQGHEDLGAQPGQGNGSADGTVLDTSPTPRHPLTQPHLQTHLWWHGRGYSYPYLIETS